MLLPLTERRARSANYPWNTSTKRLSRSWSGEPYGSLCHFDTKRCQRPDSEMSLLEMAAPIFMAALEQRPNHA